MTDMPHISDHAALRYLERFKGVDVAGAIAEMRVPGLITAREMGCDTVILGNGAKLKLSASGTTVTTCLPKGAR